MSYAARHHSRLGVLACHSDRLLLHPSHDKAGSATGLHWQGSPCPSLAPAPPPFFRHLPPPRPRTYPPIASTPPSFRLGRAHFLSSSVLLLSNVAAAGECTGRPYPEYARSECSHDLSPYLLKKQEHPSSIEPALTATGHTFERRDDRPHDGQEQADHSRIEGHLEELSRQLSEAL